MARSVERPRNRGLMLLPGALLLVLAAAPPVVAAPGDSAKVRSAQRSTSQSTRSGSSTSRSTGSHSSASRSTSSSSSSSRSTGSSGSSRSTSSVRSTQSTVSSSSTSTGSAGAAGSSRSPSRITGSTRSVSSGSSRPQSVPQGRLIPNTRELGFIREAYEDVHRITSGTSGGSGGSGGGHGHGHGHGHGSGHGHGGGHYYYGGYYGSHSYYYPYWDPFCSYPFSYGFGYYGYPWGYGTCYGPTVVVSESDPLGAIDVNVRPKDTEVYLDGQLIGTAGEYDGWPRYLWLNEGTYELILYKPGFETIVRDVAIQALVVIDLDLRMQPGTSIPAAELSRVVAEAPYPPPYADPGPGSGVLRGYEVDPGEQAPAPRDARSHPARLHLAVNPPEASVYLDGHFVGTGFEIVQLSAGLLIDAGEHLIQVVHPDRSTREESFTAAPGEIVELDLRLDS